MNSNSVINFKDLPFDILNHIASYLDVFDCMSMSKVTNNTFDDCKLTNVGTKEKFDIIPERYYNKLKLNFDVEEDLYKYINVHTLNKLDKNVSEVSMLGKLHTLICASTQVTDVSMLGNLNTLNCSHTQVSDVSILGNLYELDCSHTQVSDVSMLNKLFKLNCSDTKVTDVSMLSDVKCLSYSRI